MNRRLAIAAVLIVLFASITGCSAKNTSMSVTSDVNETYTDIGTLEDTDSSSRDNTFIEGNGYYDDYFTDFFYNQNSVGAPMEYDDVIKMISNSDNGGLDSYYLIEVNKALTLSECEDIEGWFDMFADYYEGTIDPEFDADGDKVYFDNNTVYEVTMIKDIIMDTDINETVYLLMKTGNPYTQVKGDPLYAPGETLCAALKKSEAGCELRQTTGDFMLRFDVYTDDDGRYMARNRFANGKLFPIGEDINEMQITSTTSNPVVYCKEMLLDELADFMRSDWEQQKVGSVFNEEV